MNKVKQTVVENKKTIIVGVAALFAGIIFGATAYSPKGVPQPTKVVTKEVCRNETTWKDLKEVDDRGFRLAARAMGNAVGFIEAAERGDAEAMQGLVKDMNDTTNGLEDTSNERALLLEKLGY